MIKTRFDKVIAGNAELEAEDNKCYVINEIGTDKTSELEVSVEGIPVIKLITFLTPYRKVSANLLGPVCISDLPIVVPPYKKLKCDGAAGDKVRICGDLYILAPGEALPAEVWARYGEQGNRKYDIISGSYTLAANTAWAAGIEHDVYTKRADPYEKYIFRGVLQGVDDATNPFGEGAIGIIPKLDDAWLEIRNTKMGPIGIELYSLLQPKEDTTEQVPFSFAQHPIVVDPNHEIKFTAIARSDIAAITADRTITVRAIVEYQRFPK